MKKSKGFILFQKIQNSNCVLKNNVMEWSTLKYWDQVLVMFADKNTAQNVFISSIEESVKNNQLLYEVRYHHILHLQQSLTLQNPIDLVLLLDC